MCRQSLIVNKKKEELNLIQVVHNKNAIYLLKPVSAAATIAIISLRRNNLMTTTTTKNDTGHFC